MQRRTGNVALTLAWTLLGLGLVSIGWQVFFASEDRPRPRRSRYLSEETAATAARDAAARARRQATEERIRLARAESRGAFEHHRATTLFSSPGEQDAALHEDMRSMVASEDVLLRLFGTENGDWIFHRRLGWLHFEGGRWQSVPRELVPPTIRGGYPDLVMAAGTGGGDGDFSAEPWMGSSAEDQG